VTSASGGAEEFHFFVGCPPLLRQGPHAIGPQRQDPRERATNLQEEFGWNPREPKDSETLLRWSVRAGASGSKKHNAVANTAETQKPLGLAGE